MGKKLVNKTFLIISSIIILSFLRIGTVYAQGTFDCGWSVIAGRGRCAAINYNCDPGYEPDYAFCGGKTPEGYDSCNAFTNINCVTEGTGAKTPESANSPLGKGSCGNDQLFTAIGCIPLDKSEMVTFFLQWAIGIGGGMAFLLIILASFQIMTSQGDPKRLEAGKELLNSAIMGLILLIFSVTILRLIGVNLFNIPDF